VKINTNPLVLDAPELFGYDKELYLKLKEQGAGKEVLLRVERAMKHPPKPINRSLTIPVEKRVPVKSLEDRLWARYRRTAVDPSKMGCLMLNGEAKEVTLPVLFAFVTLLEETGRFRAESHAIINWQVAVLSYMATGILEPPVTDDPDEKTVSQQIAKFVKGVIKLADS
jgi:hypothetical protein